MNKQNQKGPHIFFQNLTKKKTVVQANPQKKLSTGEF